MHSRDAKSNVEGVAGRRSRLGESRSKRTTAMAMA